MTRVHPRRLWPLLVVCLSLGLFAKGAAAHAQERPALDATDAAARRAFEAGRDAYDHGAFGEALGYFERAEALRPSPELLYNVGRAADSDGQADRAISAYTSYLATYPDADNRDFVRARLEKMRSLQRARRTGDTAAAATVPVLPSVAQAEHARTQRVFADGQRGRDDLGEAQRPVWKRAWLWVTLGSVVAAGVVAGVLATRGRDDPQRAQADAYVFTPEQR